MKRCRPNSRQNSRLGVYSTHETRQGWRMAWWNVPMIMDVSCLILVDNQSSRILATQRPKGKRLELRWEFPGGKVEDGEAAEQALRREIHEEFGIELGVLAPLPNRTKPFDGSQYHRLKSGETGNTAFGQHVTYRSGRRSSRRLLHWESQSTTTQNSITGQNYIHFKDRGYTILFFARLEKRMEGETAPFCFLGPANQVVSFEGDRPISMVWELEHPIPAALFEEARAL